MLNRLVIGAIAASLMLMPTSATAQEGEAAAAVPTGEACRYPVELLWHREPEEPPWAMGVSVINKSSGQQVPGLNIEHFAVLVDDKQSDPNDGFAVRQSANAFQLVEPTEGAAATGGVDPVNYDVYFAVDLTASMADELAIEGKAKSATKLRFALGLIQSFVKPDKSGSTLFDTNDRVFISGFTDRVEAGFMSSTTAVRKKISEALLKINEFTPAGDNAALYASILHNLNAIRSTADQYKDAAKRREAVLIVLTDSFNGMNLTGSKALRYCRQNDPLTDEVRAALKETQDATNQALKVYLLALGTEAEPKRYSLTEPAHKYCKITTVQKDTVDGRALRAIGERGLTRGGYLASTNPGKLGKFVRSQFEGLKSAYEVTYKPPEGVSRPRAWAVHVKIGEDVCEDSERVQSNIIPVARATDVETTPGEVALFLAGLMIAFFFLPRTLVNLSNLGGGSRPPPPKKKKKTRKKRKK